MLTNHQSFHIKRSIELGGRLVDFHIPRVMGIINFTPDSFYDGGRLKSDRDVALLAEKHLSEGATILDVGGYSSRPGAENISEQEETLRMQQAVRAVKRAFPEGIVSADTFRMPVARAALDEGAQIVNDISAGELDKAMFPFIIETNVPYIIMHTRGTPQTMRVQDDYDDVISEVTDYFAKKIRFLHDEGVKDLIVDPGFGFAKGATTGFELLRKLACLQVLGLPVLVGLSRKSMIYKTLNITPDEALNGTTALHIIALQNGANILRVHDVKEAVQAIELYREVSD